METELTKKMKKGLAYFKPLLNSNMRTIRFAEEVWTPTGIVDFIRFEDYNKDNKHECSLINYNHYDSNYQKFLISCGHELGKCKTPDAIFPNDNCHNCIFHKHFYEIDMMVTCYECKITLSDFKSKNGHNFCGNRNYYVVPLDLYKNIKELVPEDIGIIVYYEKTNNYRIKKECIFNEISHEVKERLLYDAFKKWVDKVCYEYLYGGK